MNIVQLVPLPPNASGFRVKPEGNTVPDERRLVEPYPRAFGGGGADHSPKNRDERLICSDVVLFDVLLRHHDAPGAQEQHRTEPFGRPVPERDASGR